ncbi:MAG: esterase family protein, partial [bacterium]
MEIRYFKEYSQCLNRDMEFNVYGTGGTPMLVFPSQDGRFYDFANNGMVDTIADEIDAGRVQLFCCDSMDKEGWSDYYGYSLEHRTYTIEQFYHYIVNELCPRIFEINANGGDYADGIFTCGCSLGASHAANFMFRNPDIFKGCIALSGYYDSDLFFGDYCNDIIYRNAPIRFINGMHYDHPYVEKYRHCRIVLCCGQGAWEDDMIRSTARMKELLDYKDVPAWIDFWGY